MKLFERIFGGKKPEQDNPSAGWAADLSAPLELDLAAQRFCGVGLGESARGLERIGPSSGWNVSSDEICLTYAGLGFTLFIDPAGNLEGIDVNLLAEDDMAAFAGHWTLEGQRVAINNASTPAEVATLMGRTDESRMADTPYLVYRRGTGLIEFDWGGGSLENILINRQAQ
ncbi:MAG TPA: hypothetical protein VD886_01930 [Herpetosiphonaceae bacterium]|nr:hypothetical protein [Herpetosiphonaceae bacterium]